MTKKLICPKCGLVMSKGSKGLWGMCAFCAINDKKPTWTQLSDDEFVLSNGEVGFLHSPTFGSVEFERQSWVAKAPVERDLFKMTVEDVILDFGCRVWEAV